MTVRFYRAALNAEWSSYEKALFLSVRPSVRQTCGEKNLSRFLYHSKMPIFNPYLLVAPYP